MWLGPKGIVSGRLRPLLYMLGNVELVSSRSGGLVDSGLCYSVARLTKIK